MKTAVERKSYMDVLNIIAIISVIAMHCNGIVHGSPNTRAWTTSLIVECLCYFAVPLFFMISGANLLKYRERYDTKTFFSKRLTKVLIPFVFWATIMFIWKISIHKIIPNSWDWKYFVNGFFQNTEETTYYFMFDILALYLTIPFLSLVAKKNNKKVLWFTVFLYIIFNGFIPNILCLFKISFNTNLSVQIGKYACYAILGYLLSDFEISKKNRVLIYIGALIGLVYRFTTTYFLSKAAGKIIKITWGYGSWHCMLLAISVFLIVKHAKINNLLKNPKIAKSCQKLAGYSFGIYLIHLIVKHYIVQLLLINPASWQFRTIGVLGIYMVSAVIVAVMKKIPILKIFVP